MKKLTALISIITFLLTVSLSAQNFQAGTYIERTHISPKMGTSIGYSFDSKIEVGGFYQSATAEVPTREDGMRIYEEQFYGAFINYPIAGNQKANLKFNIRTGVTNGENFLITPSILGNYQILHRIMIGTGVGIRTFRPTLQASIKLNL